MQEWYALDAIARWREKHHDSTPAEEEAIYRFHMGQSDFLVLRCTFENLTPTGARPPSFP